MKAQQKFLHAASVMVWLFTLLVFYVLEGGTEVSMHLEQTNTGQGLNTSIPQADAGELSDTRLQAVMRQNMSDSNEEQTLYKQRSSSFSWYVEEKPQEPEVTPKVQTVEHSPKVEVQPVKRKSRVGTARRKFEQERDAAYKLKQEQLQQMRQMFLLSGAGEQAGAVATPTPTTPKPIATVVQAGGAQDGFYGLMQATEPITDIRAVIHGEHRNLQRGSVVKLRLLDAICIQNNVIPANTFLYGQLSFSSCRATIRIDNIQYNQTIYPFEGTIYDNDGFEGLYVPDNKVDQAARKAGSNILSNANLSVPGPAFIASAANAALGAVQTVAQHTVSEPKINISSNYLVTIKQQP
ncbi:MAG: conjugative transposon protein TraM [Paludibacteraceae bacterium]|nr:conjugative transposon protein TraM [Paludibacteraceae bacterium]